MNKAFDDFLWEDYPNTNTPLGKRLLNKVNSALKTIDERVRRIFNNEIPNIKNTKLDIAEAYKFVKGISLNKDTGVFTITFYDNTQATIDTMLEKLAVNFDYYADTQKLVIILSDGTQKEVDLSALITQYEFLDSDTIAFSIGADGKVSAIVKEGSIQEKHLRPDYLSDIRVESAKAESSADSAAQKALESADSALLSKSYSGGNTGIREGEGTDNAKYYSEQAKQALESLEQAGTVTGVKGNAEVSYRTGNVDITPENIGAYPASYIDDHLIKSGHPIPAVGKDGYIAYPSDGRYYSTTGVVTGCIKISLPVSWTSTMLKFIASIYDWRTGDSFDYIISGYNNPQYTSGGGAVIQPWQNYGAVCIGRAGSGNANLPVRFGHDGSKCVVTIGNVNTTWNYPHVLVHGIMVSYHESSYEPWKSGWTVSFETSLPTTVNATVQNTHVAYGGVAGSCNGNSATATKATQDGNGNNIANTYQKKEWTRRGIATMRGGTFSYEPGNYENEILLVGVAPSGTFKTNHIYKDVLIDSVVPSDGIYEYKIYYDASDYILVKFNRGGFTFTNSTHAHDVYIYSK